MLSFTVVEPLLKIRVWQEKLINFGLTARIKEKEYFIDELDILVDRFVLEKMTEFLKKTQEKDRNRLMRVQILGREFELRADEKNQFIETLKGNKFFAALYFWLYVVDFVSLNLTTEFGINWCKSELWSMGEDYRIASEINKVAIELNNVFIEKDQFLEELDSLGVQHVPAKTTKFLTEIQAKDKEMVKKLRILQSEMELNARKKDMFIEKLKVLSRIKDVVVVV
uniref:Uncharacterized protein n=1 Tax=Tanacetum cinerariifolium TaxID=118510 RepID=A0A699IH21_TANCI|nr:hypothetical protein [Tanacetum cinerariifolium]